MFIHIYVFVVCIPGSIFLLLSPLFRACLFIFLCILLVWLCSVYFLYLCCIVYHYSVETCNISNSAPLQWILLFSRFEGCTPASFVFSQFFISLFLPSPSSHCIRFLAFRVVPPIRPFRKMPSCLQMCSDNQNSVSTGPYPGPGLLQSNIASVRSQNIFWTGLSPCVAFALLFLFISYKPHFTSATKK